MKTDVFCFQNILRFPRDLLIIMFRRLFQLCHRNLSSKPTPHQAKLMARSLPKKAPLPGVENIVVVASGKGGVGKSTVAANLAVTFASIGKRVGLLDADIFGPSIPLMLNLSEEPLVNDENLMLPPINYGVKCLSMGMITDPNSAVVWRGPLVMSAIQRLLKGAVWGPLDILIVDTPPGTGDVHLSLTQNVPLSGVLLVSTPQVAALQVTLRGAQMYRTFGVPIFGLVENMGHAICDNCQHRIEFFNPVTEDFARKMDTNVLASLPLDRDVTEACDNGKPIVFNMEKTAYIESFRSIATNILRNLTKNSNKNAEDLN